MEMRFTIKELVSTVSPRYLYVYQIYEAYNRG